jgi:hypothetical protein
MSSKSKYRWYDEEEDQSDYNSKKKNKDRRNERKLNTALRSKNYDYLVNDQEDDR